MHKGVCKTHISHIIIVIVIIMYVIMAFVLLTFISGQLFLLSELVVDKETKMR
jgi:hypothetical protein